MQNLVFTSHITSTRGPHVTHFRNSKYLKVMESQTECLAYPLICPFPRLSLEVPGSAICLWNNVKISEVKLDFICLYLPHPVTRKS